MLPLREGQLEQIREPVREEPGKPPRAQAPAHGPRATIPVVAVLFQLLQNGAWSVPAVERTQSAARDSHPAGQYFTRYDDH
jgi:hypothetical protein